MSGGEPEPTDDELAARAQAGQTDALGALTQRHQAKLVRLASYLTGDVDEAESLAQEAMTRAVASLSSYRPELPWLAWLRGILLNLVRQHQRRRKRHAAVTDPSKLAEMPGQEGRRQGVLSTILRNEQATHLWLAVGQLPESYREVFVLHYVEGLDYAQISQITGIAEGTLRVRALRGRNLLKMQLGPVVDTWLIGPDGIDGKIPDGGR